MKKVVNIVFYKFFSEKEDVQIREQACIFYDDGTVASVSVDEAVEAAHQIAVEEKIKNKDEFRETVNKNRIHVMSGEDFERRFQEFVGLVFNSHWRKDCKMETQLSGLRGLAWSGVDMLLSFSL